MGELARWRRGRDLHLSRGHLAAALVGVGVLCITSFALGTRLGSRAPSERAQTHFASQSAGEDLVALLALVETAGDVHGGVDAMTFPSALTASSGGGVADAVPRPDGRFHIELGRFSDVALARALRDHVREAGGVAWVSAELRAGVMSWRVAVGGYSAQDHATEALVEVDETLEGWTGVAVTPRVVSR
jgi:hypothetical protein